MSVAQSETITITGQAAYRERIALRPGLTFTVTLEDISIADRQAPVLATVTRELNTEQVPLAFELSVDRDQLSDGGLYSLRATILDPTGALSWTTDTAHLITTSPAAQSLGTIRLVRPQSRPTPSVEPSKTAQYDCAGTSVGVSFQSDAAVMTLNADSYDLAITTAASGAKYISAPNAPSAMFWEKGDTAILQIGDGDLVSCNKIETL